MPVVACLFALKLTYHAFDKKVRAEMWVSITQKGDTVLMESENDKGLRMRAWCRAEDFGLLKLLKFQDGKEKTYAEWLGDGYRVRMWGKESKVSLSQPIMDRHTLALFLSKFPFSPGAEKTYSMLVEELAFTGKPVQVVVKCLGKERVETPAGDFDAWKLELKGRGLTQLFLLWKRFYLWYDAERKILVSYRDSDGRGFDLVRLEP